MRITFKTDMREIDLKENQFKMGGMNKKGETINVNNFYLTFNNKPWMPIMGEFHFSRYNRDFWEIEILKLKACGITVIATYIFWLHHEEKEGEFCFKGNRDLRWFLTLCQKHHMWVFLRLGPWCHGEVRNGGYPDWILSYNTRVDDLKYLKYVRQLYNHYYNQVDGFLFKQNGCVIGVQIENEFEGNPKHLVTLKKMALEAGFDVPLYSITGWGGENVPKDEFLPAWGGYPEAPWEQSINTYYSNPHYTFIPGRLDPSIGCDLKKIQDTIKNDATQEEDCEGYPFITCELGSGVQVTRHRRPVIRAHDVYAILISMLGKGLNMPGYYMFHGGYNPSGPLELYQESVATGYPNDVPVKSYDFQAPIGEFGFIQESYRYYKLCHMFIAQYGEAFVQTKPIYANKLMSCMEDCYTPRVVLRGNQSNSGFIFLNTYQRTYTLQPIRELKIELGTDVGKIILPMDTLNVPEDKAFFIPYNFTIEGVQFKYITAQPITEIESEDEKTVFFAAIDGVAIECALAATQEIEHNGKMIVEGENKIISEIPAARNVSLCFLQGNKKVKIVFLSYMDALNLWKIRKDNRDYAFITNHAILSDEKEISLYGPVEDDVFKLHVYPNMGLKGWKMGRKQGIFYTYNKGVVKDNKEISNISLNEETKITVTNTHTIPYLFTNDFNKCKQYRLLIGNRALENLEDLKIYLRFIGDVLQLYAGNELIYDNFNKGTLIEIGLKRFESYIKRQVPLYFIASPLEENYRVYLERRIERNKVQLEIVKVQPYYKVTIE